MDIEYSNVVFSGADWTNSTSNVYMIVTNRFVAHYYDDTNEYLKAEWHPNAGFVTNVFYKSNNPLGDPITNYPYYSTGLGVALHISFVERTKTHPLSVDMSYLPYEPYVEWKVATTNSTPPLLNFYFGSQTVYVVGSVTNSYYPPIPFQSLAGIWSRYNIGPAIEPRTLPNGFVTMYFDKYNQEHLNYGTKEDKAWWPITEEIGPGLELAELVWIPDVIVENMIDFNGTYEWDEDEHKWVNDPPGLTPPIYFYGELESWGGRGWYYIDQPDNFPPDTPPILRGSALNRSNVWFCCGGGLLPPPYSQGPDDTFWTGAGIVSNSSDSGQWVFRHMQDLTAPDTNAPTFVGSTIGYSTVNPAAIQPGKNVPKPSVPVAYVSDSKSPPYGLTNNAIQARYNAGVSNTFPAGTFTVQGQELQNGGGAEATQSISNTNATDVTTLVHGYSTTFEHVTNMYYSADGTHGDSISFGYETNGFYLWQSVPERGLLMVENYDAYYNFMRACTWAAYSDVNIMTNYSVCPDTDAISTWSGWGWTDAALPANGPIFDGDGPDVPGAVVFYSDDPCHIYEVTPTGISEELTNRYFQVHYTNECATSPYSADWDFKYRIEAAGTLQLCNRRTASRDETWNINLGAWNYWTNTWVDGVELGTGATIAGGACVTRSWSIWKYAIGDSGNQDVLRTLGTMYASGSGPLEITDVVVTSADIIFEEAWLWARRWAGAYVMDVPWHWRPYNNPITNIFYDILSEEDFYIRSGDPSVGTPYQSQNLIFDNEGLTIRYDPTNMLAIFTYLRTYGPDVGGDITLPSPHIVSDYCVDLTDFPFYNSGKFSTKGWRGGVGIDPLDLTGYGRKMGESMFLIRYDVDGGFDQGRYSTGSVPD